MIEAQFKIMQREIEHLRAKIGRLRTERDDLYQRLSKYPAEMKRLHEARAAAAAIAKAEGK